MIKWQLVVIIIFLLLGSVLSLIGLTEISPLFPLMFEKNLFLNQVYSFLTILASLGFFSIFAKNKKYTPTFIVGTGILALSNMLFSAILTVLFFLSSMIIGRRILAFVKIKQGEDVKLTSVLIGTGFYGTLISLTSHFPINYPFLFWLIIILPLALGYRHLIAIGQFLRFLVGSQMGVSMLDILISALGIFYVLVGLMPEVGYDALVTHLFVPNHLDIYHQWAYDVKIYSWAAMPMMADWIFSIGYILGGETSARLINVSFVFILAGILFNLTKWASGSTGGAKWAVLIFLTSPLTYTEISSLFTESVWSSFLVLGIFYLFKFLDDEYFDEKYLYISGILLGLALATKAVTVPIVVISFLAILFLNMNLSRFMRFKTLSVSLCLFFVIGIIPYVFCWHITSNPVFPFFNKFFQSPFGPIKDIYGPPIFGRGVSWDLIYRMTFKTGNFMESYPGASGFQWILIFVPVLFALVVKKMRRALKLLLVSVLSVCAVFYSINYLRYILPSYVWAISTIGVAFSDKNRISRYTQNMLKIFGGLTIVLNFIFLRSGSAYGDIDWKCLLSTSGRLEFVRRKLPIRNLIQIVNSINHSEQPIAVFADPLMAGLRSDAYYPNWYNPQFRDEIDLANSDDDIVRAFLRRNIEYIILDENWKFSNKKAIIKRISEKVSTSKNIELRKLKDDFFFKEELLTAVDFNDLKSWTIFGSEKGLTPQGLFLEAKSSVSQMIEVHQKRRYKYNVVASCLSDTGLGRMQVNWLDFNLKFISADIDLYNCDGIVKSHSMEVVAPKTSVWAIVYGSSHNETPIRLKRISFTK